MPSAAALHLLPCPVDYHHRRPPTEPNNPEESANVHPLRLRTRVLLAGRGDTGTHRSLEARQPCAEDRAASFAAVFEMSRGELLQKQLLEGLDLQAAL
jgi:hypothetical protein